MPKYLPADNLEYILEKDGFSAHMKHLCNFCFTLQTHYVMSEGQTDLDVKQNSSLSSGVQVGVSQPSAHSDPLEAQATNQQQTTQYIITTTTNGNGGSEVHITKPRTFPAEHEWRNPSVSPDHKDSHPPKKNLPWVSWSSLCFQVFVHFN